MNRQNELHANALLDFIRKSPTTFHAVQTIQSRLQSCGFTALSEAEEWNLTAEKGYYLTRNQSTVLAFRMPKKTPRRFMIVASHTDSPMLKLKPNAENTSASPYVRLNTELYGGTILSTWLDRPLSLAGRVVLNENGVFSAKTVKFDRDLLLIPNVAIHLNRTVNNGYTYNPATDLLPLLALKDENGASLKKLIAEELSCSEDAIVSMDMFVVCRTDGSVWGSNREFFSAPRIDNLMCVFGSLEGFLSAEQSEDTVTVYYAADNEETGSATKQGAGSVLLSDVLDRICNLCNVNKQQLLATSMMVSADNAHAKHPNHPELSDALNAPLVNGGVVVKSNAAQKYTTDAVSFALFSEICRRAGVPTQQYSNRSDLPGGSTLGSISNTLVPLVTVDIGMAQLAMHSAYETAGTKDVEYLTRAMTAFYNTRIYSNTDGTYCLEQ